MHQNFAVQPFKETVHGAAIFGHYTICVIGAILADMSNRLIDIGHGFRRNLHVQEFFAPVVSRSRLGTGNRL